jgi:ADP-ribose pyrophosphatase
MADVDDVEAQPAHETAHGTAPGARIVGSRRTALSPWVTVVERAVDCGDGEPALFHSLALADYVSVLAETAAGEVVLVRQYRSAWEQWTVELPGGLLDPGEEPGFCAARELEEETGFRLTRPLEPLGGLITDTGRLENRIWGFHAVGVERIPGWRAESGVEPVLMPRAEFKAAMLDGRFGHALHIALVGMAMLRGRF